MIVVVTAVLGVINVLLTAELFELLLMIVPGLPFGFTPDTLLLDVELRTVVPGFCWFNGLTWANVDSIEIVKASILSIFFMCLFINHPG